MKKRFMWPIANPWTFSPWGYALALIWNGFELAGKPMPFAPYAFGVICGRRGKQVNK